ncbi:MAG: hypothetical protein ACPLKP_02175 [Microgenomates group bacterium]
MIEIKRHPKNPILTPDETQFWEAEATFNGSIAPDDNFYHFVYRAVSFPHFYFDKEISLSTIGYAKTKDGVKFFDRQPLIMPEYPWEQFGCEDPRITKFEGKYWIFYTALSNFPPSPQDIKIGVAITSDFKKLKKHQVTDFNSKAMALFPERINGKIVGILTVNTDLPPAKIALVFFDNEEQIWSKEFWHNWLSSLSNFILPLKRNPSDQVEVGAPPLKTPKGWLLIYSHIKNYLSPPPVFGIEAVLLDLENPLKILGRTLQPLLIPLQEYELYGRVPNVIFPSGAVIKKEKVYLYYGAADTSCCLAEIPLKRLLTLLTTKKHPPSPPFRLEKYLGNPILTPKKENKWESKQTFNPGVIFEGGRIHLLYRAVGEDNTSVLGYASSKDGFYFDERLTKPVYLPREEFEKKTSPEVASGCEDPRLTKIGDRIYMLYTAFDGKNPWKVAMTSIKVKDFLAKNWQWEKPIIISHPERSDKNACLLEEKINNQYVFFHRIGHCIWIDFVDDLEFKNGRFLGGKIILWPRKGKWDSHKVEIAGPPLKTKKGWLLIYHGLSLEDKKYRLGAVLLELKNPEKVISQLDEPILEPEEEYEKNGVRPGTVFSCGAVILGEKILVYYGAGDQTIAVASVNLNSLLNRF